MYLMVYPLQLDIPIWNIKSLQLMNYNCRMGVDPRWKRIQRKEAWSPISLVRGWNELCDWSSWLQTDRFVGSGSRRAVGAVVGARPCGRPSGMDLTTRTRPLTCEDGKVRMAKSVFTIRRLMDVADDVDAEAVTPAQGR